MASKASQPKPQTQLVFLAVALIAISAFSGVSAARPCKTLLISSFSFSVRRHPHQPPSAGGFVTVFTQIIDTQDEDVEEVSGPALRLLLPQMARPHHLRREVGPVFPSSAAVDSSAYDLSSLRDRTKDILSVVVALLFGVGCGALTAATMYLAWSLFAAPRFYRDDEFDSSSDEDEIPSPKKIGYIKIPAAAADDSAKQFGTAV